MQLENISFEVTVILGTTNVSMNAYMELQVGDIVVLDQTIEKGLIAQVGSTNCFLATAGLFETHKAITIDERIHA